jgi:hypothetical protein
VRASASRTTIVCAVATLLFVSSTPMPSGGAQPASTTRALTISTQSASPQVAFQAFDGNPPKVFDFNQDGVLEIIAQNDNQYVYVFDSQTGAILHELKTKFPPGWGARSFNGPEAAVLMHGDGVHLIVANSAATITSYRFDAVNSNHSKFKFIKEWDRRLNDCFPNPGMDSKPVLVDLDLDRRLEIVAATEESGIFALRADGTILWKACVGGGNAEPSVGDLNQDGVPDVVFASDGGRITAFNGLNGATLWSYYVPAAFNVGSGSMPVGPAVAQLDGVGGPDVVVGVRDSHDAVNFANDHALLLALNSNGGLLWGRQHPQANPLTYTHPIVVDADMDGHAEVYWGDWNTIGHKPPANEADAWKVTGPANFFRYDKAGTLVWRQSLDTYWSNKDLALADVDGDGVQEVLANGPQGGSDGIWYLDSATGAKESFVSTHPWKVSRAPIVADLWGTATMQWVVGVEAATSAVAGGGILVFDTGKPYNSKWPHLPYPTTPAPWTPPPGGYFNATFTIKSPNAWWQEVKVVAQPNQPVAGVSVRIADGPWRPLTLRSWGNWAGSHHATSGTKVEFLAMNDNQAQAQSAPFTWLNGELTKPSIIPAPPPAPGTSFTATFTGVAGNNHWVEVNVTTIRALSAVHAIVNGTTHIPLELQPWGHWAKGVFIPGATLQFRAIDTLGNNATSASYTWPPPNVNVWWVEVKVTSAHPISGVAAIVNDKAPVNLTKQTWGNWAKSFHVAQGSTVRFQATSAGGASHLSQNFTWLGPAPPPPPFNATFSPRSITNNWWVEVAITATRPVSQVEVQIDGGAWISLPKTAWGTWAKSFFVPDGAVARFRASDAEGTTIPSAGYVWG